MAEELDDICEATRHDFAREIAYGILQAVEEVRAHYEDRVLSGVQRLTECLEYVRAVLRVFAGETGYPIIDTTSCIEPGILEAQKVVALFRPIAGIDPNPMDQAIHDDIIACVNTIVTMVSASPAINSHQRMHATTGLFIGAFDGGPLGFSARRDIWIRGEKQERHFLPSNTSGENNLKFYITPGPMNQISFTDIREWLFHL